MSNNENIVRARRLSDGRLMQEMPDGTLVEIKRQTDWTAFDTLTDEEVEVNAFTDPDGGWVSEEEFIQTSSVPMAKLIRLASGLTQEAFAARYEIPLGTLRDWEQGVSEPDSAAKALLKVIHHHPDVVAEALSAYSGKARAA